MDSSTGKYLLCNCTLLQKLNKMQSWAEAVANDVTFLVIQAGNTEIICMRDRVNQTLFISDILEISSRDHPYRKLHTGLYIAAIRDAEDRARSISMGKAPETWTMRSGINEVHGQNYTGFTNKEVGYPSDTTYIL